MHNAALVQRSVRASAKLLSTHFHRCYLWEGCWGICRKCSVSIVERVCFVCRRKLRSGAVRDPKDSKSTLQGGLKGLKGNTTKSGNIFGYAPRPKLSWDWAQMYCAGRRQDHPSDHRSDQACETSCEARLYYAAVYTCPTLDQLICCLMSYAAC